MERVRIAVTQFKARDIESFDDFQRGAGSP
jgi:hypothetical protein